MFPFSRHFGFAVRHETDPQKTPHHINSFQKQPESIGILGDGKNKEIKTRRWKRFSSKVDTIFFQSTQQSYSDHPSVCLVNREQCGLLQ